MRTIAYALAAFLSLPAVARAQTVDIHVNLPAVLPQLVVVQPGVQVVPEVQEECFYHDGWYWVRRDRAWYRSRDYRRGWVVVPVSRVPPRLAQIPPGHYRNWKVEKEMAKADRKAEKRHEKEERHHDHGRGHGRGHGNDD